MVMIDDYARRYTVYLSIVFLYLNISYRYTVTANNLLLYETIKTITAQRISVVELSNLRKSAISVITYSICNTGHG